MNEINKLKSYLTRAGILYISDEMIDDIKYIHFTYEHDNFTISINDKYKLIILNKDYSFYEETGLYATDLFNNAYDLEPEFNSIEELSFILENYINKSNFKDYSLTIVDYIEETFEGKNNKYMHITTISSDKNVIDLEQLRSEEYHPNNDIELIEYTDGLSEFHNSIFQKNWLENFNKKIKNYDEQDLYILISTLAGYTYKLINNVWNDELIDPYVVENATGLAIKESKKFNNNFLEWYSRWNKNLPDEKIKEYVKRKHKKI